MDRTLRERLIRDLTEPVLDNVVELFAIDRVLERLTHRQLRERSRGAVLVLQPELELHVCAGRLLSDPVLAVTLERRRGVGLDADHVDVAGLERSDARRTGRHFQEVDTAQVLVDALVPVVGVLLEQDLVALGVGLQLEGAGTDRVLVGRSKRAGRHDHAVLPTGKGVQDLDRLVARQRQLEVRGVDDVIRLHERDRSELRVLAILQERLADGLGIHRRAVGELHVRLQFEIELESLLVGRNRPRLGEARVEVPLGILVHQGVVDERGDDAVAIAGGLGHVERARELRAQVVAVPQDTRAAAAIGAACGGRRDADREYCRHGEFRLQLLPTRPPTAHGRTPLR